MQISKNQKTEENIQDNCRRDTNGQLLPDADSPNGGQDGCDFDEFRPEDSEMLRDFCRPELSNSTKRSTWDIAIVGPDFPELEKFSKSA